MREVLDVEHIRTELLYTEIFFSIKLNGFNGNINCLIGPQTDTRDKCTQRMLFVKYPKKKYTEVHNKLPIISITNQKYF